MWYSSSCSINKGVEFLSTEDSSMATPHNFHDLAGNDSSDDSSITDESAEEGEFEIVHTTSTESKRSPKYKLCGVLTVEGSSGDIRSLATSPKDTEEIYLTNRNDNNIFVTSPQGDVSTKLDSSKILLEVEDVAVSDNGNVIVAGRHNDIHVYDRDGNMVNSFKVSTETLATVENATRPLEITSVDIDRNRKIAIGCCHGNKGFALVYEIDGEFKRRINFSIQPQFISSRYLLVAASDPTKRVVEVRHNDNTGELVRILQMRDLGPRIEPCGILLTWDHLFVVSRNAGKGDTRNGHESGSVHLYDTNTMVYLGVAVSRLTNPCAIDITSNDKLAIADENQIKLFEK